MILVVDNGSVYTQNLIDILEKSQKPFKRLSFSQINFDEINEYDSIILSGRRSNNQKMNSINSKLIKKAISDSKPLLGICYGAEILALTLGGTIKQMKSLQKGTENIRITKPNSLYSDDLKVFESHRYEISRIPDSLEILANSDNCDCEIIQYKNSKIFGTQFHPEMSEDGIKLILNFSNM